MNNELYHYGVLGMKWGVRKQRSIGPIGSSVVKTIAKGHTVASNFNKKRVNHLKKT